MNASPTRASRKPLTPRKLLASACTTPAEGDLSQPLTRDPEERALAGVERPRTTTAFEVPIQNQGLPSEHLGKQIGWPAFFRGIGARLGRGLIGIPRHRRGRVQWFGFGSLVTPQLVLDVRSEASATSARRGIELIANPIAYPFSLFEQLVEESPDIVADAIDHREDLFENIPDEVRGGHPKILGESTDVLRKLFRHPGMENSLLTSGVHPGPAAPVATATAVSMAVPSSFGLAGILATLTLGVGIRIGVGSGSHHESHCDTL